MVSILSVEIDVKLAVVRGADEDELEVVDVVVEVKVEEDEDVGTAEEDEVSGTIVLETEEAALLDGERAT